MRVIYATGQHRHLDFAIADKRADVPAGAVVFALCTAERTIENLDEDLFGAISDEEYYTFRGLVNESGIAEPIIDLPAPQNISRNTTVISARSTFPIAFPYGM